MGGSGLAELWERIYGKATIVHMMTGHAYSRSLRAHFLTQRAIGGIIVDIMDKLKLSDKACDELRRLYTQYMDSSILRDETMESSELGNIILTLQSEMKQEAFLSRTSKLWHQYYKQVDLMPSIRTFW